MNHYPHHIGDYIKSTVHLSNEEDLTYLRLMHYYYDTERPISKETQTVSKRLRLDNQTVIRILTEFFLERDDGWHNKRCDEEIAWYQALCARNREVGKLGGRPRKTQVVSRKKRLETERKPNQNQNQNQNHKPVNPSAFALPDWVPLESWQGFVEMRTKSKSAFTERAKTLLLAELLKLKEAGGDPVKILDQSTANGWKGVFAIKGNGAGKSDGSWLFSDKGTQEKGREVGLEARPGESMEGFRDRIRMAQR